MSAASLRKLCEHADALLVLARRVDDGTASPIDVTTLVAHATVLAADLPALAGNDPQPKGGAQ